ncbi:MAG TPA: hypothetical protein VMS56_03590 [Thermoanaerobaculia bacterium]|nr:hypothetical protein [Thermoanaerobaculia bacterium]
MVPVYLDFGKNVLLRIAAVRLAGGTSEKVSLELALPRAPRRAIINSMHDVLSR